MSFTSITVSGGGKLPIVRWVYLIQDSSDVTRIGGVGNNAYNTLTAAYTAADTLQLALGSTNIVAIKVIGKLTGASGNITLTANWNPYVALIGDGPEISAINTITLSNALGSGFNFGTAGTPISVYNIRLGTSGVNCNATGPTGNGGEIAINSNGSFLGSLSSRVTDITNTAGSTGNIRVVDLYGSTLVGTISNNLDNPTLTGNKGSLFLRAASRMIVGAIENLGSDLGGIVNGGITITNADCGNLVTFAGADVNIKNCTFAPFISLTSTAAITIIIENTRVSDNFNFTATIAGSTLNLRNFEVGWEIDPIFGSIQPNFIDGFKNVLVWNSYINNSYSLQSPGTDPALYLNQCENILIRDSVLENIEDVNTQTGTALSVVQIDPSVLVGTKMIHVSVTGAVLSMDAVAPVTVDTFSTYDQQPNGVNITINPL